MSIVIDKDLERAIDGKLSGVARRPAPPAPQARVHQPVVRFNPMFADTPPAAKRGRRILVGVSIAVHVLLFVAILLMPKRADTLEEPSLPISIVFTAPVPPAPEMTRPPAMPKPPPPKPKPKPVEEPPAPVAKAPEPIKQPVLPEVVAPKIVKADPPKPRPEVKVGLLDEAPSGPTIVASRTSRSAVVVSGFEAAAGQPSTAPRQGRVMEAAFDTTPAKKSSGRAQTGTVQESGFGVEADAKPKPKVERERPPGALDSEVEILSKPKPVYTDEARGLKIEGDVVLDVTFEASGRLVVLGVAQGLGHGLDEAAVVAAKKIQFNPARRDGAAVDHSAKLRVVFRLA